MDSGQRGDQNAASTGTGMRAAMVAATSAGVAASSNWTAHASP
jgi:hypothetical protein